MPSNADGIVYCGCGARHWGLAGAAGVMAWRNDHHPEIIVQLRAQWSMSGGTWSFPGGAIGFDESPIQGGVREAREEAGLQPVRVWASTTLHHPVWSFTSAIAEASPHQIAIATDHESDAMEWVAWEDLIDLELMQPFEELLPLLDTLLGRTILFVDRDLVGDLENLERLASFGFPLSVLPERDQDEILTAMAAVQSTSEGYPRDVYWFPDIVVSGGPALKPIAPKGVHPPACWVEADLHAAAAAIAQTGHYRRMISATALPIGLPEANLSALVSALVNPPEGPRLAAPATL